MYIFAFCVELDKYVVRYASVDCLFRLARRFWFFVWLFAVLIRVQKKKQRK